MAAFVIWTGSVSAETPMSATASGTKIDAEFVSKLLPESGSRRLTLQADDCPVYTCNAWTTCADGSQISCNAYGTQSCNWSYQVGVSVTCDGYGLDGTYATYTENCY